MTHSLQSHMVGNVLHAATGVVVSIFQAGLVKLAVLSFSLLATFAASMLLAGLLPDLGAAGYTREVEAEALEAVPDGMGRLEAWIVLLGMPISVFVSLLTPNARSAMWLCVAAMAVAFVAIEGVALMNSGHGIVFVISGAGLSAFLLLLMVMQWLAFHGFLWAAGVRSLAPTWGGGR